MWISRCILQQLIEVWQVCIMYYLVVLRGKPGEGWLSCGMNRSKEIDAVDVLTDADLFDF